MLIKDFNMLEMPQKESKRRLSALVPEKDKVDLTKAKRATRKDRKMFKAETFENILFQTESQMNSTLHKNELD